MTQYIANIFEAALLLILGSGILIFAAVFIVAVTVIVGGMAEAANDDE